MVSNMQIGKSNQNRIEVLDGLKGLSLVIIIAYYYLQHLVPGGFVAVNLFFLIGGFLNFRIFKKRIILEQPMEYRNFLRRRFDKLFFPMLFMMIFMTVFIMFISPKNYMNLRNMGLSSLLFVNNFYQIITGSSFFAQTANQSVFAHLWYSSMYAQLILLTPLLIESCYKWHKSTSTAINMLSIVSLISMVLMWYLQTTGHEHSSIFFNTLARLFAYTLGGVLSLAMPYNLKPKAINSQTKRLLNGLGIAILWLMWMMIRYMYGTQPFAFRFGITLFTLLSLIVIFITLYPDTWLNKFFSFKPFVYLGKKSYTYYLWFYPIVLVMPELLKKVNRSYAVHIFVGCLLLVVFAEFAYYLIESRKIVLPFGQDSNIRKTRFQLKFLKNNSGKFKQVKFFSGFYGIILFIGLFGILLAPQTSAGVVQELAETFKHNEAIVDQTLSSNERPKIVINNIEGLEQEVKLYANAIEVTFVGDSIFLASAQQIIDVFPKAVIDANEARQLYNSVSDIESLKAKNKLAPTVITLLGTNGAFTKGQLDDYIEAIGENRMIYFVLISPNRAWTQQVNNELFKAAQRYGNVRLIDWASVANTHPDWLLDEFHPNEKGSLELAKLMANELYRQQ